MRVTMKANFDHFNKDLETVISKVGKGSRKAVVESCEDILAASLEQVPRATETLARSAFYEIQGNSRNYEGVIGYGGNGDPINPVTGEPASEYMVVVHEDLSAEHPVGNAKFLENAVSDYATENFPRTVIKNINESLR